MLHMTQHLMTTLTVATYTRKTSRCFNCESLFCKNALNFFENAFCFGLHAIFFKTIFICSRLKKSKPFTCKTTFFAIVDYTSGIKCAVSLERSDWISQMRTCLLVLVINSGSLCTSIFIYTVAEVYYFVFI